MFCVNDLLSTSTSPRIDNIHIFCSKLHIYALVRKIAISMSTSYRTFPLLQVSNYCSELLPQSKRFSIATQAKMELFSSFDIFDIFQRLITKSKLKISLISYCWQYNFTLLIKQLRRDFLNSIRNLCTDMIVSEFFEEAQKCSQIIVVVNIEHKMNFKKQIENINETPFRRHINDTTIDYNKIFLNRGPIGSISQNEWIVVVE